MTIFFLVPGPNKETWMNLGLKKFGGVTHIDSVISRCLKTTNVRDKWVDREKEFWVAVLDRVIEISRQFITLRLYASKMSRNGSRINEEDRPICGSRRGYW